MNAKQTQSMRGRFHAIFAECCRQFGLKNDTATRHQLSEWILGYSKSSSKWSGKEYSLVIDQIANWIKGDIEPHKLDQNARNLHDFDQRKKQLIHSIETAGAPEAYIQKICDDHHSKRPWRDLGTLPLSRLRMTIKARMAAKAKKAAQPQA